jgi:hypothetical protein
MNYFLLLGILTCFVIGISLTMSIPDNTRKNLANKDDPKYVPYDIQSMTIFSYIFYGIGGVLSITLFIQNR